MKTLRFSFASLGLAALLLSSMLASSALPVVHASTTTSTASSVPAKYQPAVKKSGMGRVLDWGLAKLEAVRDSVSVPDLIAAFVNKCEHALALMVRSFGDVTLSYDQLLEREAGRLAEFEEEFRDLLKLRNRIDRKCLYASKSKERTVCVERGIEVHESIGELRAKRAKSLDAMERYEEMIEWCASYKNWFC